MRKGCVTERDVTYHPRAEGTRSKVSGSVKGTLRTPAGRLLLQGIRTHVQPPEILPDVPANGPANDPPDGTPDRPPARDGTIVLIGRGIDADRVTRSLARFAARLL